MEFIIYEKKPGEATYQTARESASDASVAAERHIADLPHGSLVIALRHEEDPDDCVMWVYGVEHGKPTLVSEADLRHNASHAA